MIMVKVMRMVMMTMTRRRRRRRRGREAGRGGIVGGVELEVFNDGFEQWESRQE